jgi:hypothetical protein
MQLLADLNEIAQLHPIAQVCAIVGGVIMFLGICLLVYKLNK